MTAGIAVRPAAAAEAAKQNTTERQQAARLPARDLAPRSELFAFSSGVGALKAKIPANLSGKAMAADATAG